MELAERIKKAPEGSHCQREIRLDPAGKPVFCPSKATLVIRDRRYCQKHAQEQMTVIALTENRSL